MHQMPLRDRSLMYLTTGMLPCRTQLTMALLGVGPFHKVGHEEDVVGGVRTAHILAVVAARANHGVGDRSAGAAEGKRARAGGGATSTLRGRTLDEGQCSLGKALQLCAAWRGAKAAVVRQLLDAHCRRVD